MMAKFSELPSEIQLLIFKQFDRPTLHSTVQVNEAWHHMSADLLWEEPSFGRIAKLVTLQSVQRRQYYASKIQKFKINRLSITCAFDKLVFSSLQDLRLHSSLGDPRASIHLIPYLQRAIRTLSFRGCGLDSRSLGLIASCCPALERLEMFDLLVNVEDYEFAKFVQLLSRLRELFLGGKFAASAATIMLKRNTKNLAPTLERLDLHLVGSPDPESFRMFVMNCESLQHLSIHSNPAARPLQLMTGRVLAHVLNANPLQHLSGDWLSPGLLQQIPVSSTSVQSFGKLKSLMKSGCASSALTILLQTSSRLQKLELYLQDVTTRLFSYIGSQRQLRHLAIASHPHQEVLSMTHLSPLANLTSLECLDITYRCRHAGLPRLLELDDSTFARLVSGFSQLTTLVLNVKSSYLSVASIRSISQACPLLKRCALVYDHDLYTWGPLRQFQGLCFQIW
ncbi:hypothetical protein KCU62_g3663, partial [Aureobasidium sp. EXF-3399]